VPEAPPSLLQLPARDAAHRLLLSRFEEWTKTRRRLDDPEDTEALHDFRVALRRLRSILRAFRPVLADEISPKLRRQLRRLADATGVSRDLEVQRAWLTPRVTTLAPRQRRDGRWLLEGLGRLEQAADEELRDAIADRFDPLRERLWDALSAPSASTAEDDEGTTAARLVAASLRDGSDLLRHQLAAVHTITDDPAAHEARIQAKRLRYLLESFEDEIAGAPSLIERLKQLQDLLGELHDLHRLAETLRTAFRDAAVGHAEQSYQELLPWAEPIQENRPGPATSSGGGLAALARLVRSEGEALFARAEREWLSGGGARLCDELRALGDALEAAAEPDVEIERKYLLSGVPPAAAAAPGQLIEQGWLPGTALVERIRHVTDGRGESWYRTVKSGAGVRRIELEEAMSRELFEALWPLTEGCRVRKRRHVVTDGGLKWEVDIFDERGLVMAEIELPSPVAEVQIPDWLKDYVIREVTNEEAYLNRTLAS